MHTVCWLAWKIAIKLQNARLSLLSIVCCDDHCYKRSLAQERKKFIALQAECVRLSETITLLQTELETTRLALDQAQHLILGPDVSWT